MTVPVGYLQLRTTDPPLTLIARLNGDRPNIDSGYGGWGSVVRPRRRPLTTWLAAPALHMTVGLLLDGFHAGNSVEQHISRLERMAFPTAADGNPPRLKLSTTGSAIPHQDRTWVIDALTWGDAVMSPRGNRLRQQVSVALLEYVADVYVANESAANRQRQAAALAKTKPGAAAKRVVAKAQPGSATGTQVTLSTGQTLLQIAATHLGDATRWPEIAQLNGIRDPRSIKAGQVIRLP
jgi:LysM repeat protein